MARGIVVLRASGAEKCSTCEHWCERFSCWCGRAVFSHLQCGRTACRACDSGWLDCEIEDSTCDECGHPVCDDCSRADYPIGVRCDACAAKSSEIEYALASEE